MALGAQSGQHCVSRFAFRTAGLRGSWAQRRDGWHTSLNGMAGGREHGRRYFMFWVNMILRLAVVYVVMFTMIDGLRDFRNMLNMLYMAITM